MSDTNTEAKKKSGGSGTWIFLLILSLAGVMIWKNKRADTAAGETIDASGGITDTSDGWGGGSGSDGGGSGYYDDVTIVDTVVDETPDVIYTPASNGSSGSTGSSGGGTTPIKQAMTARTQDAEWQYQKSRINMDVIPAYQRKQIEKGAITKNTLKSIADYQQVKAGTLSAYDYAGGAAAMPGVDPVAYDYASTAYQRASVKSRALAYYSGITEAHRGGMTAAERTAWDSANEKAALEAYANAAGSGLQADTARKLAAKLPRTTTVTASTSTSSLAEAKAAEAARIAAGKAARTSTASKGSAQPGKGSGSTAKTATKTVAKAAATKGISGAVKAAASLSKK